MTEVNLRAVPERGALDDLLEEPGPEELRGRVVFSLLRPAILLSRVFALPLRDVRKWFELAYFRELRRQGLSVREASEALDVSVRKVAELSAELKRNFFDPERAEGLPRRIEFMLTNGPMTEGRIRQALSEHSDAEVDAALGLLVEELRVERISGRTPVYSVAARETRLVRPGWRARIDGLNQLVSTVSEVVWGRFFRNDARAFARTLQLRVRQQDLQRLHDLYEQHIWPALRGLDEAAADDDDAIPLTLSLLWGLDGELERDAAGGADEPGGNPEPRSTRPHE